VAESGRIEKLLGAGAGLVRMNAAVAGDLASALNPLSRNDGTPDDWLDAWDPSYIRTTLPTLRMFADVYHRAEVRGLDNIPAEGPVLLVGNHSGGTLISDTFVFAQAYYDHLGPLRRFHQLAHDLVFQLPGVRASLSRFGTVPASPENMQRALDRDAALLVYPGGDHVTYLPTWEWRRSTSPAGRDSRGSPSSTVCPSCRSSRSAGRRPLSSSGRASASRGSCNSTACCA
jgi:Acyltransferase